MEPLEMHYAMMQKLNKSDSQQLRNLRPQEMDWYLNESQLMFIKTVANPKQQYLVETNQRMTDDLAPLVVHVEVPGTSVYEYDGFRTLLPLDDLVPRFMYYISAELFTQGTDCCTSGVRMKVFIRRHSDLFRNNVFYNSSLKWREAAAMFENSDYTTIDNITKNGPCLVILNDEQDPYDIHSVDICYIRVPRLIFSGGYTTIDGTLTSSDPVQSCELPFHVHEDIVDIAAMMAASNMMNPDIQAKIQKIQMNNN